MTDTVAHNSPTNRQAVTLLSGGLDSAVATWLAQQQMTIVLAITVDYGQQAFPKEWQAAQALADWMNIPIQLIELPWLKGLLPKGFSRGNSYNGLNELGQVWVPNRNGVLLNVAASVAEANHASAVVFGANLDEAASFPDNSQAYVTATNQALAFSTRNQVNIISPTAGMTKADMLTRLVGSDFPTEKVWSCYVASDHPCGQCLSCQHRRNAEAGMVTNSHDE